MNKRTVTTLKKKKRNHIQIKYKQNVNKLKNMGPWDIESEKLLNRVYFVYGDSCIIKQNLG